MVILVGDLHYHFLLTRTLNLLYGKHHNSLTEKLHNLLIAFRI